MKYNFNRDELYDLYIVKNLTRKKIAEKLNVKERIIKAYLSKFNIKKPLELQKKNYTGGHTTGLHWYNNGIKQVYTKMCPEGYIPGVLPTSKTRQSRIPNISEEGRKKLQEIGRNSKGRKHTEITKQKISESLKKNPPITGPRSEEVKNKIRKKLTGRINIGPKRDKIHQLSQDQLLKYLNNKKEINFIKIYEDLNILNNQDSWEQIMRWYDVNGISYVRPTTTSNFEEEIFTFIADLYTGEIKRNVKHLVDDKEADIYIPEKKLIIECNGVFWHQTEYTKTNNRYKVTNKYKSTTYHYNKSKWAYDNDLRVIHIWEDQWRNARTQPILKAILAAAVDCDLGIKKIYARKCKIQQINKKQYAEFCNKYHTQQSRPAEICLGLFYENELVQVASFSKCKSSNRKKTKLLYEWEWIRGCEQFNHSRVIGGVSKLFKYFIKEYNPKSILCYSDFNLFCGKGYSKCGFELNGFTGPDKFYVNKSNFTRINRNAAKYKEYMENCVNKKWLCCYGAGSLKFVWTKK